jgi:hypothetical protein
MFYVPTSGLVFIVAPKNIQKNTIDALASYRGRALTILASFASMSWDKELRDYALAKIRQINEGAI